MLCLIQRLNFCVVFIQNIAAGKQEEGTFCFSSLGKLSYSKVELEDDGSVSEVDKDISLLKHGQSHLFCSL